MIARVAALAWLCAALVASETTIDRAALDEALRHSGFAAADIAFDLAYLDALPEAYFSAAAATTTDLGHLGIYRRSQRAPLTLPDEVGGLVERLAADAVWDVAQGVLDHPTAAIDLPAPAPLIGLPLAIAEPIGRIVAAIALRDAALIVRAIDAARPALSSFSGPVDWDHDGVVVTSTRAPTAPGAWTLWIRFGGDDAYVGAWAAGTAAHPVAVVIDTGGDDRYTADADVAQGAGRDGIGILVDLAGDDRYTASGALVQGAAERGTGVLIDVAGDDQYVARVDAQGSAKDGIGLLIDHAGCDRYEAEGRAQGYAGPGGFGALVDHAGDDDYLARDPLHGDFPVTDPAPQDQRHNASMCQGVGSGDNACTPYRAGGVGLLVDLAGDDRYRAGCWAQGVGYFLGIGALIDRAGDDRYTAWLYVMGAGAHAGAGLQVDDAGDDTYTVGAWNCLGMAVDHGLGVFLDGAGNDRYVGAATGHGASLGMGVALFQDSAGDDRYEAKEASFGSGRFYEQEDFDGDGAIAPAERHHWGVFVDGGGHDAYPAGFADGGRWPSGPTSGGCDR